MCSTSVVDHVLSPSATLTGNKAHSLKNSDGRDDGNHVAIYRASDLQSNPDVQLTHGGLILIGILRGGDYHQAGLTGCGPAIAHGLAKCGFGDTLLTAVHTLSPDRLQGFLTVWRQELREELRTNSRGHLGRKNPTLARSLPESFPDMDVLLSYTNPLTSESKGKGSRAFDIDWEKEPDLGKVAGLCEMYFEWGVREIIIKRFRTVLWPSAVLRILRRAVLLDDKKAKQLSERAGPPDAPSTPKKARQSRAGPIGTPSKMIARHFSALKLGTPSTSQNSLDSDDDDNDRLLVKIHSSRTHSSTDGILEYRLEVAPAQLIRLCEAGVRGLRTAVGPTLDSFDDMEDDSDGVKGASITKKPPPDPQSHLRIWLPACMVRLVEPSLVAEFEDKAKAKEAKKAKKGTSKTKGAVNTPRAAAKNKKATAHRLSRTDEESGIGAASTSEVLLITSDDELEAMKLPSLDLSRLREEEEESASDTPRRPVAAAKNVNVRQLPKTGSPTKPPSSKSQRKIASRSQTIKAKTTASNSVRQNKSTAASRAADVAALFNTSDGLDDRPSESSFDEGFRKPALLANARPPVRLKQRRSLLDVLDDLASSQLSSGMSSPEKSDLAGSEYSPAKPRFVPQPFPLALDDHFSGIGESSKSGLEQISSRNSASDQRRSRARSPDPERHQEDSHNKSSTRERTKPRSIRSVVPTSAPTALSRQRELPTRSAVADESVIEISSDSDPQKLTPPLLQARARAKIPATSAQRKKTRPVVANPTDIIDLT